MVQSRARDAERLSCHWKVKLTPPTPLGAGGVSFQFIKGAVKPLDLGSVNIVILKNEK